MHIHILELKFTFSGKEDALYPVLLQEGDELILVDCGYEGFMPLLECAASEYGLSLDKLTGIIITHHDMDHMGGLFELKAKYPLAKIYSSAIEATYISGKAKSLRLVQAETLYDQLPEDQKPGALYFQEMLRKVKPVEVECSFGQDEELPFIRGVQVVQTPGHTPGHISIYHTASKTFITADALVYEQGQLDIANPNFTLDLPAAINSVKKMQVFDIDAMICYHGGIIKQDIPYRLNQVLTRYMNI